MTLKPGRSLTPHTSLPCETLIVLNKCMVYSVTALTDTGICVCTHMHGYVCMLDVGVCIHVCIWELEGNLRCHSSVTIHHLISGLSLAHSSPSRLGSWPVSPRNLSVFTSQHWNCLHHLWLFKCGFWKSNLSPHTYKKSILVIET